MPYCVQGKWVTHCWTKTKGGELKRKVEFEKKEHAEQWAARMSEYWKVEYHAYYAKCGFWHIGRMPSAQVKYDPMLEIEYGLRVEHIIKQLETEEDIAQRFSVVFKRRANPDPVRVPRNLERSARRKRERQARAIEQGSRLSLPVAANFPVELIA